MPALTNLNEDDEDFNYINACARVMHYNIRSSDSSPEKHFETHNQREFSPKQVDISKFKRFFKRKNQFQQWSEALYNNGVFFNPSVNGL
jgi:hypothetical protein